MRSQAEIGTLTVSLLLVVGAAGLTASSGASTAAQTPNTRNATPLPFTNQPPQDRHPQIILRVYNYAHVDAGLLLGAEAIARGILREAELEPKWVDCPRSQEEFDQFPECREIWGTNAFVLNLLTPEMAARIRTRIEPWDRR